MRIARYEHAGVEHAGVVQGEHVRALPPKIDVLDVLTATPAQRDAIAAGAGDPVGLDDVHLRAPLRSPRCATSSPSSSTSRLEVAAIVGRPGRDLTVERAREHIAGDAIFDDWSGCDLQGCDRKLGSFEQMLVDYGVSKRR